jgi:glycosyltransferase involved in cell wall biosynthesis
MALRVAVVHSFYSSEQPSGENTQVESEVEALAATGVDVRLFAARTDQAEAQPLYRVRAAARVATGRGSSPLGAIEAWQPDVVHVHNLFPNIGRTWTRHLPVPLVVTLHNFRFACANGVLVRDGRQCTDCPDGQHLAALRHRCYRDSLPATIPLAIAQARGARHDPVLSRASRILCLSARQRQMLVDAGLPSDRLLESTNFLPDRLDPARDQRMPREAPSGAISVGRLTAEKGVVELAATWSGPGLLDIVGGGPLLEDARNAAIGRPVEVLGPMTRSDVVERMSRRIALVFPGETPELAPLSYMEALAGGVPVVVRRRCDLAARVENDGVGLVVDGCDEIGAAVKTLAEDRSVRNRCRAVYEQRYTESVWIRRMLAVYSTICDGRPAASWR